MIDFTPVIENPKPDFDFAQAMRESFGSKPKGMGTKVIYRPSGKASEYARLALNIYKKCTHRCQYCYAPSCTFVSKEQYFSCADPKKDIVAKVKQDAELLSNYNNVPEILLSFIGDPYQHEELELGFTRQIISILIENNLPFTILTKGGSRAIKDFDLLSAYPKARFGTSLVFTNSFYSDHWEPGAASVQDRVKAIKTAHNMGIKTWLSLEPVIYPDQAIKIVKSLHPIVDHWKVGKINHNKKIEKSVDWVKFRNDITATLRNVGADFYLKKSLTEYQP